MSIATITPTIERNNVHNYWTAEMSDVLAHALAEALPDDPDDKPDPDRVRELTQCTIDTRREVKKLTHGVEETAESFKEQIGLEVMALTLEPNDPERLEKTVAPAIEAAGKPLSLHAHALLNGRCDGNG